MIACMPELYPDELVYSWLCRYHVYSGNVSHKKSMQELYCKKSDTPSKEFIGNLNQETRECINKIYPIEDLVLNHTMYPQYARFIPLKQKMDALYKLCHETCDVHQLFGVLPRCEKEQHLKYCPICTKEDRQSYGEAYWHRKHQIRNIGICLKHKCKLQDSVVSAKNMNSYVFSPAELSIPDIEGYSVVNNPLQIKFAEYTEQVFDAPMDFEKDIPLSTILYHAMKDTEYMKSTGSCRYMTKFVKDMTRFYEQIELNEIASIFRIQRTLLSGENYDFSVACQIGFFLDMTSEELTDSQLLEDDIKQEDESHYIKGNTVPDWEEYDEKMSVIIDKVAVDIYNGISNDIGKPEKVTPKLICRLLEIKEHRLENMPKSRAVLEKYFESYPELWARKLVWAYNKISNKDKIYWSDTRKLSCVKKEQAIQAIPYLSKYTTNEISYNLINIIEKS